ncbi:MAG: lipoate--protein ligase family protein [Spirochaetaceae bacterium]|jgi:lipoate-protein ligase A|nr:lipoate--protein ligase family protein [Spirochaetaceae bacterium]
MDREPSPFRLLYTGLHDGFYNMGLDEAILEGVSRGESPPTLRLYGWSPPAVSVGYFQGLEEEVDLPACEARGIDVVRRISGGGAVFHQAELTYSVIMADTHPLAGKSLRESYENLCVGIVEGLALLGVPSRFVPINDIVTGDRKISGNAQTRRMGCILQHGTVILDLDVDLMFELLRVPREKMRGRIIRDVKDRVTSLRALRPAVSLPEAAAALAEGFRRALSLDYGPSGDFRAEPGSAEAERARALGAGKFASREWLYKR